ncbi:MAG: hypothetical protein GX804_05990, partial [Lentisphaerae bacterium]|nr:hypothetical protein [Lentisphaerota bacterium]
EGMIIGTPNYQSPEQIECSRTIDFHADMYSTGALFYEMITGEAPFGDEEDPLIVMDLQRAGTLPNPREADKSIKPGFVYVMQKMMAKDAKDRYTWWQDVIEDLQRVLDGRPPYPQDGGTYAPPHSTIGIMQGDVSPETATPRSIPVQSGQKKVAAMRTSSQAVSDRMKLRPRGTGCLAQIGAFIFIVAALCLTVIFTVKRPVAKDSRPEEIEEVEEYTEADVGETIGYDNLDYTTVQETPQAKTDETQSEEMPEVKAAPPALKEAVADIYRIFMDKKFVEAKAFAQKRLLQARDSGACDKDQCEAIAGAFENAALYVDIVGDSLMQSSATREISIGGNIFKLASKMYANGFIVGTITGADGVTRENFNIDLSKMTPSEMFYIMESGVTPTDTQSLLALAFLSLKAKEPLYFKNIVDHHNLEGLKPFIELSREE